MTTEMVRLTPAELRAELIRAVMSEDMFSAESGQRAMRWRGLLDEAEIEDAEAARTVLEERLTVLNARIEAMTEIPFRERAPQVGRELTAAVHTRRLLRFDSNQLGDWIKAQQAIDRVEQQVELERLKIERLRLELEPKPEPKSVKLLTAEAIASMPDGEYEAARRALKVERRAFIVERAAVVNERLRRYTRVPVPPDAEPVMVVQALYHVLRRHVGDEHPGERILTDDQQDVMRTARLWLDVNAEAETLARIDAGEPVTVEPYKNGVADGHA